MFESIRCSKKWRLTHHQVFVLQSLSSWDLNFGCLRPGKCLSIILRRNYFNILAALEYPIEDEKCLMDDIWLHSVKFYEVSSESQPQMALNLWVIKIYGISDPIQLLGVLTAWFGLIKVQADRYSLIRNRENFETASWSLAKSFFDVSIPVSSTFIGLLMHLSEDCTPAWFLLVASLAAHPLMRWIVYGKLKYKEAQENGVVPKAKNSSRHSTVGLNAVVLFSTPLSYSVLAVSKRSTVSD